MSWHKNDIMSWHSSESMMTVCRDLIITVCRDIMMRQIQQILLTLRAYRNLYLVYHVIIITVCHDIMMTVCHVTYWLYIHGQYTRLFCHQVTKGFRMTGRRHRDKKQCCLTLCLVTNWHFIILCYIILYYIILYYIILYYIILYYYRLTCHQDMKSHVTSHDMMMTCNYELIKLSLTVLSPLHETVFHDITSLWRINLLLLNWTSLLWLVKVVCDLRFRVKFNNSSPSVL